MQTVDLFNEKWILIRHSDARCPGTYTERFRDHDLSNDHQIVSIDPIFITFQTHSQAVNNNVTQVSGLEKSSSQTPRTSIFSSQATLKIYRNAFTSPTASPFFHGQLAQSSGKKLDF